MKCLKCRKIISKTEPLIYGLHKECFAEWFKVDDETEFSTVIRKKSSTDETANEFNNINSSFFQGTFKKYSASLGPHEYILKVEETDYPELPVVEYVCNQIAGHLKIKIPDYYLIDFHGLMTFVTKNFIDKNKRMTLHHIYHYVKKDEGFNVTTLIGIIEKQTGRLNEVERFVRLCLFDSLTGNHDRHGRNLAFIEEKSTLSLSPFYDNPSYIGVEETSLLAAQHSPRGKIATSLSSEPTMSDYVKEFIDLKLQYICENFYQTFERETVHKLVQKSLMSEKRQKAFLRLIDERYQELKDGLGL